MEPLLCVCSPAHNFLLLRPYFGQVLGAEFDFMAGMNIDGVRVIKYRTLGNEKVDVRWGWTVFAYLAMAEGRIICKWSLLGNYSVKGFHTVFGGTKRVGTRILITLYSTYTKPYGQNLHDFELRINARFVCWFGCKMRSKASLKLYFWPSYRHLKLYYW